MWWCALLLNLRGLQLGVRVCAYAPAAVSCRSGSGISLSPGYGKPEDKRETWSACQRHEVQCVVNRGSVCLSVRRGRDQQHGISSEGSAARGQR